MAEKRTGTVVKGIGGFYYITDEHSGETVCCRMRGSVRLSGLTPSVGDKVIYFSGSAEEGAAVLSIEPRVSLITRPPCANAEQAVITAALKRPAPDTLLIDKLLCDNALRGLKSILVFNKSDLAAAEETAAMAALYAGCGAAVIIMSARDENDSGYARLRAELNGRISVMRGVSGAGKTTLITHLAPHYASPAGEVSRKNGRGRQTTRQSELIALSGDTFILDTPGFSSFELSEAAPEELWKFYPEFYEYSPCRFPNCLHLAEPDCAVKAAVEAGDIPRERYENYVRLVAALRKNARY